MQLRRLTDEMALTDDDRDIDFTAAGLYIVGLQVVMATVFCACTSVLCCWLLPSAAVSAVRTLAITTAVGLLAIHKPIRLGRVRGVTTVFNALRPSVLVYIQVQVLEQLVHTCVPADLAADHGTWRKVIFHLMILMMIISGLLRARSPRSDTDFAFLVAGLSLLVVALLPPPAKALTGPLCSPSSLLGAGERVLRALLFSALYVTHVYAAAPNRNAMNELLLCVMRCTAASIWVLGATPIALPLAVVQLGICLHARLNSDVCLTRGSAANGRGISINGGGQIDGVYSAVDTRSDGGMSDVEAMQVPLSSVAVSTNGSEVPGAEGVFHQNRHGSNSHAVHPAAHLFQTSASQHYEDAAMGTIDAGAYAEHTGSAGDLACAGMNGGSLASSNGTVHAGGSPFSGLSALTIRGTSTSTPSYNGSGVSRGLHFNLASVASVASGASCTSNCTRAASTCIGSGVAQMRVQSGSPHATPELMAQVAAQIP